MIDATDKMMCCGCNACGAVCARDAIIFKTEIEDFGYPEVDKDRYAIMAKTYTSKGAILDGVKIGR